MATKYDLTESAKSTKNNVFNSIINELENGPGQFTENLENLKGVLYNPTTQKEIHDKKVIEILAQGKDLTDQRFVTFSQAQKAGMHISKDAKGIPTVNYSLEQTKGNNDVILKGRTVHYFNGKDITGLPEQKLNLQYTDSERLKLNMNLVSRIKDAYENGVKAAERKGTNKPEPMPERADYKTIDQFFEAVTGYAVKNTMDMNNNTENLRQEYFRDEKGKSEKRENSIEEIAARSEFRKGLATALLNREIGNPVQFRKFLETPAMKPYLTTISETYKRNPEKLSHDINAAVLAKNYVKNKVMFLTRHRKSKEEIQSMEDNLKRDPNRAGKALKSTDYYQYTKIDIPKKEDIISKSKEMRDVNTQMVISKAQDKAMKTLETQILNMTNYAENTVIISKSLCDKISDARKNEGLESDPKKFLNGYMEFKSDKGTEIAFKADIRRIQSENLNHKQIINCFANGKERDSIDIVEKMKSNELAKAEKRVITSLKAKAGKTARTAVRTKISKTRRPTENTKTTSKPKKAALER